MTSLVNALKQYKHPRTGLSLYDHIAEKLGRWTYTESSVFQDHLFDEELPKWRFVINGRTTRRLGCCRHRNRTIEVHSSLNSEEFYVHFVDTLLHEVAHLIDARVWAFYRLTGKRTAHGRTWKTIARCIGATPKASALIPNLNMHKEKSAKHRYTCKDCGHQYHTQRQLKNLHNRYHGACKHKEHGGRLSHEVLR